MIRFSKFKQPSLIRCCYSVSNSKCKYSSVSYSNDNTCDIAIIGSGIMGLNTAYQIARRSPSTSIKIFERSPGPGYGSSGASSAICRCFYTFDNMIKIAKGGMNIYQNWNEYLNYKCTSAIYTKTGLLSMSPFDKTKVENEHKKYDKLGVKTTIIDKNTMKTRFSQINSDCAEFDNSGNVEWIPRDMNDSEYFLYEDNAGYFEPVQALTDLKNVLKEYYNNSVITYYNTSVNKILHSSGNIKGISVGDKDNNNREINCKYVINCCGPWYNKMINDLNLDIKLTLSPVRIQVIYKDTPELYTNSFLNKYNYDNNNVPIPIISDLFGGIYMRAQKQSKQILCSTAKEEEERDIINPDNELPLGADPEYRDKFLNGLYHRLSPILNPTSSKVQSLNGIYTVCEDDVHYLIGPTKLNGFIVCNGFSGHGFKSAPMVGSLIAQYITNIKIDGDTDVPIDFYSPYREPYTLKVKNVMA